jgi:NAD(P)-dependent dehydrogenase (short-subunit alcohol dehydrogenase family)
MGKLDNKVIIVTGATGGIGSAAAALFSREGAKLVLTGRDEVRLREAAAACDPERTRTIVSDNADAATLGPVVALAVDTFGGLDGAFLNAGHEGRVAPITQITLEEFDQVFAINVRGTFAMLQKVIPPLTARGGGSIVVTSSTSAIVGIPMAGAYGATKAALLGLVRSAALELIPANIRINTLIPGGVDNRMIRAFINQMVPPEHAEAALAGGAAGLPARRFGTNEELAKAALFLISDDSSYSVGSTLVADGGMTID